MPAAFKDYYTTLGVARDADEDTIRKAFRKLAAKYHPDVAKDKKAGQEPGHLFVVRHIVLPTQLTSEEWLLWENLRQVSHFTPGQTNEQRREEE